MLDHRNNNDSAFNEKELSLYYFVDNFVDN